MTTKPQWRKILIALSAEEFDRLVERAERDDRTPDQQAQHIVKAALKRRFTLGA